MRRREFLTKTAYGVGAAWLSSKGLAAFPFPTETRFGAADVVTLGKTGIKTSRLACGTGTHGGGHHSNQTALGIDGLADLLWQGYDHGLRFYDAADQYGSHPHVAAALKRVPREKVTVLTKTRALSAEAARADLDRFRKELDTDYIDILLMHCMTEGDWTEKYRPVMDVLSEAKEKKIIRAHGCSCHTMEALRAAAQSPWVQVDLARMNPIGSHMDSRNPEDVLAVLRQMKASGKAIIGMKILGEGDMRHRVDDALNYGLSLGILDAFTIGAESRTEQLDLMTRIAAVNA